MVTSDRVLFVDDDPPVRTAFARTLRSHRIDVDLADGAAAALRMAAAQPYAVIATDYRMPDIDGLELVNQIQQIQPNATFMLVSGECDLELAMEAVNDHSVAFVISKPWDAEEIGSMVKRGIEAHQERAWQHAIQKNLVETSRTIEDQKQRLARALTEIDTQMDEVLLNTLEAGIGGETRAHCQRVARYAQLLAEALQINGSVLSAIRSGALLHDIGKIGVPESILNKPTGLSDAEMSEIKRHPEIGAHMLEGYPRFEDVRRIVAQHHERWDGKGYPAGLAGEQIVLGARILAVADAVDAMLSSRPYRAGMDLATVITNVIQEAGCQFDPTVVAAFNLVPPARWLEARAELPDAPAVVGATRSAA
ncbi:MAG: HD domain-containing protein [Deltaproteobacteria bacterium]|nr:HD domain-containing protein [Deltaproteobacteria bacterium]